MKDIDLTYPKAAPGRIPVIDELRGLAILLVLMYHIGGVTGFPNTFHGDLGVDIFVMLSGAALAMSNRPEEGGWAFLYRRLVRILPAYWIVLTAYAFANHYFLRYALNPQSLVVHYLCLHGFWGDRYILDFNDSFWFLALCFPLYVVFAMTRGLLDRMDKFLCIGFALSFIAAWVTFNLGQPATFIHLGLRPAIFFVGVPFGILLRKGIVRIPMTGWFAIAIILPLYAMFISNVLVAYTMCGFSLCIGYFAARVSSETADSSRLCGLLAFIGGYSYEIFLVHQPLIRNYNGYWQVWGREIGVPEAFAQAWGVVFGLALTWFISVRLHKVSALIAGKMLVKPALPKPG
jgi:peptidoglycan/LPS O-acetylase OafA/YrhL